MKLKKKQKWDESYTVCSQLPHLKVLKACTWKWGAWTGSFSFFLKPQICNGRRCFCKESSFYYFFFSSRLVFLLLCFMYFSFSPFTECGLHKCKGSCPPPLLVRNFTICRLQLTINFCLLWEGSFNQAAHCELNPFLLSQENNPSRLQW